MDDWNIIKSGDLCERCYWGDCGGEPGRECKLCEMWGTGKEALGNPHRQSRLPPSKGAVLGDAIASPLRGSKNGRMVSAPAEKSGGAMLTEVVAVPLPSLRDTLSPGEGIGKETFGKPQPIASAAVSEGERKWADGIHPYGKDGKCLCGDVRKGTPCPYFRERSEN